MSTQAKKGSSFLEFFLLSFLIWIIRATFFTVPSFTGLKNNFRWDKNYCDLHKVQVLWLRTGESLLERRSRVLMSCGGEFQVENSALSRRNLRNKKKEFSLGSIQSQFICAVRFTFEITSAKSFLIESRDAKAFARDTPRQMNIRPPITDQKLKLSSKMIFERKTFSLAWSLRDPSEKFGKKSMPRLYRKNNGKRRKTCPEYFQQSFHPPVTINTKSLNRTKVMSPE